MPQQKNNNFFYAVLLVIVLLFVFSYYQNNQSSYRQQEFTGASVGVISGSFKCEDTDNGRDYNTKGTVTRYKKYGGSWRQIGSIYTDYCYTPTSLNEYYCNQNANIVYENKLCNCQNGACVQLPPPCTDECSPYGAVACATWNVTKTCGNYDSDSCLEWGGYTACPFGTTCSNGVCF